MRKWQKAAIWVAACATALAMSAGVFIGVGAFKSVDRRLPVELQGGVPADDPAAGAAPETDVFGNVQKAAGEQARLVDEKTGRTDFTFKVAASTLLESCSDRMGEAQLKPQRRKFLVLDIEASLEERARAKAGGKQDEFFMPLLAEAFSVVDDKGAFEREVASESAWGCYADSRLAPALINPGETVRGKIVLDVDATRGRVAYDPDGNGGWSWPFGG